MENVFKNMLEVSVAGLRMKNPLMLASGILDMSRELMERLNDAGAIVTKSVGIEERHGYKNPTVYELPCGLLNSMGLPNPGVDAFIEELKNAKIDVVVGSIFGGDAEEFALVAERIALYVDAIEMNMSCPHAKKLGAEFPDDEIEEAVKAVKSRVKKPVFVKLGMENLISRATEAVNGGADALVAINTIKAMAINIEFGVPVLSNKFGGYSGKGIKPIGVRCVYELSTNFDIPVIGVGGIENGEDVIEYMMAGASAVQIGTALMKNINIFSELADNISVWLEEHGYDDINEIVGMALKK